VLRKNISAAVLRKNINAAVLRKIISAAHKYPSLGGFT